MFNLLDILLRRIVQRGALTFIDAGGSSHTYGDGRRNSGWTGKAFARFLKPKRWEDVSKRRGSL